MLLLQEGSITGADGQTVYDVTRSMVKHGTIYLGPHYPHAIVGVGDHLYSKYAVGLSLVGVVPYLLGSPAAAVSGHEDLVHEAVVASIVPIASGGVVAAVYALARRLGASVRASLLVAVGSVFGTFFLPYTAEFFSEPFAALGLVVSTERALAGRSGQATLALGVGALFREQTFLLAPVLLLFLAYRHGWRSLRSAVPPLAGTVAVVLAWNYARFGDATESGYAKNHEGFTTPLLKGFHGLLLTTDKSLFLFAPIMLLVVLASRWLWRARRAAAVLVALYFMITLVLAATWHDWKGGWCWGPRLVLPAVPVAIALLAPWLDGSTRRFGLAAGLFALGLVISLPGMVISTRAQQLDRDHGTSPSIGRQVELIPSRTRYSFSHLGAGTNDDHRRWLDYWQLGVGRELGTKGLLAAVPPSIALAALALGSGLAVQRRVLALTIRDARENG